ncbi:hypothetical protein [Glycomyces tarimensis]
MSADQYGEDATEPRDDAIAAAFAAYRADAPSAFPPPSVDDLIMSGPAALRRRRIVSFAAVLGACTAVTAGGFAVAQTIGSTPKEPEPSAPPSAVHGSPSSEESEGTELGAPLTPEAEDEPSSEDAEMPVGDGHEQELVIGDWDGVCAGGSFDVDLDTWEFAEDTEWTVAADAAGDLDADGTAEAVLALTCADRTAVAAFTAREGGLEPLAWVWQPDESQQFSEIAGIEAGVITLQGLGAASETWTVRYEWDGEAFVAIDDEPSTEPSSPATTATPGPGETQTTQATPTDSGQG